MSERLPEHAVERLVDVGRDMLSVGESGLPRQLGKYELRRILGRGGMGIVYEARQISLDRRVALKVLPLATSSSMERFRREARATGRLNHPNISRSTPPGSRAAPRTTRWSTSRGRRWRRF